MIFKAIGDGSCLVHAFIACISKAYRDSPRTTQQKIGHIIRMYMADVLPWYWKRVSIDGRVYRDHQTLNLAAKQAELRDTSKWLGEEDWTLLGLLFKQNVHVHIGNRRVLKTELHSQWATVHLINTSGAHYDAIIS